jgi:hypothetical protein
MGQDVCIPSLQLRGMLFFNSGYGGFGRPGGNVLLAFGPKD